METSLASLGVKQSITIVASDVQSEIITSGSSLWR